jgi:hypothetical protein
LNRREREREVCVLPRGVEGVRPKKREKKKKKSVGGGWMWVDGWMDDLLYLDFLLSFFLLRPSSKLSWM